MSLPNSLIDRLFSTAQDDPSRDALVTPEHHLSYSQLAELVVAQASVLSTMGVSAESVVGIHCAEDSQHILLCLAAVYLGATSCAIPTYEPISNQQAIAERCRVTHTADEETALAFTAKHATANDAPEQASYAQLLFSTSGTTGTPKLVIHQDNDLVAQAHRHIQSGKERFLCLAAVEHNFSKRHRLYCIAMGATNVFVAAQGDQLIDQCLTLGANVIHVSAFQAQELLANPHRHSLKGVRLKLGGSHVPTTLRQQLRENITPNLQAGYGTTETGAIAFTDPNDDASAESVGRALPGIEVRVISDQGESLAAKERGEILIRAAGMFRGYLDNVTLTDNRLRNGWFHTGDIGYLDDDQRIYLCGRADDMFLFNSINIYPQDIESQICQHPDIREAAVLAIPSKIHNNIPVALVVYEQGAAQNLLSLKTYVEERVGVRCPRRFTVVDEIPRNSTGKIARADASQIKPSASQIRAAIIRGLDSQTIARIKPTLINAFETGSKDIKLRPLAMDSLARMNLLINLEVEFGVVLTPLEFGTFVSLAQVAEKVLSLIDQEKALPATDTWDFKNHSAPVDTPGTEYIVRFFQRAIRYCHTAAQLNNALLTFEHRLLPTEVALLAQYHKQGELIPSRGDTFQATISQWLGHLSSMMSASGKQSPETFKALRITSTVTHFVGSGDPEQKTLIVCFAQSGGRRLLMPNAVLLQHTDATRYDLLLIAEPGNFGYRHGVPTLGKNVMAVIAWLKNQSLWRNYQAIRTIGCSAGGYPAVIAGHALNAEMAISVGGRFHAERYVLRILDRIINTWRGARMGQCSSVLMCYGADKSRDKNYARVIAALTKGHLIGVGFAEAPMGHYVLNRLAESGTLKPFLEMTLFAEINQGSAVTKRQILL